MIFFPKREYGAPKLVKVTLATVAKKSLALLYCTCSQGASGYRRYVLNSQQDVLRRIWFGWVYCSLFPAVHKYQSRPTQFFFAVGNVAQMPLLTYFSLGWVGLWFTLIFICFPTRRKLVNRKHPSSFLELFVASDTATVALPSTRPPLLLSLIHI